MYANIRRIGRTKFRSCNCLHSGKKHLFKHRIKQQVTETHIAYLPTSRRKQEIQISAKGRKLLLFGVDIDDIDSITVESDPHINSNDDD